MLDIKRIRQEPEVVQNLLNRRSSEYQIQEILDLNERQRQLESARSRLKARSNEISKEIGQKIQSGLSPESEQVQKIKEESNQIKQQINELEPQERDLKTQIQNLLLSLPNLPSESTPVGEDEDRKSVV